MNLNDFAKILGINIQEHDIPTDLPESLKSNYKGVLDNIKDWDNRHINEDFIVQSTRPRFSNIDMAYKIKKSPLEILANNLKNSSNTFSNLKANDIMNAALGGNNYE